MSKQARKLHSRGFTIVEMMIALSVLAAILLITAAVITRFNISNRRALTQTTTLTTARSIQSQVSEWLQFTDDSSVTLDLASGGGGTEAYCFGDVRVSYMIGRKYTGTSTTHAMISDTNGGIGCGSGGLDLSVATTTGREHLGSNMRLSRFDVTRIAPGLFEVDIRVVYGDDDLLCSQLVTGSCTSTTTLTTTQLQNPDLQCRPGDGSEFCAVSQLTTTVKSRL